MSDVQVPARRGGRAARQALRSAPLARDVRPVNPGMAGGRYKVLTDAEVMKVHLAALDVLEHIGLADAIPSCVELLTAEGLHAHARGPPAVPAVAHRGHARHRRPPLPAVRAGSAVRHGAVGQEGLLRHRGRRRADHRPGHRRVPREHRPGLLRHRPPRRHDGAHPLLPTHGGAPRPARPGRDGHQHLLPQRGGHHQARRHVVGAPRPSRGLAADAPPHRRRRGRRGASGRSSASRTASSCRR